MELTPLQTDLLHRLRLAVQGKPSRRVAYCCEWLGYLPFGLYHWVEVDGQDISRSFPCEWGRKDLEALENAGLLARIEGWKNPQDDCETKIIYDVILAESDRGS